MEQRKQARGKRVFLDYLRNAYGGTAVASYGVRAIEGAPVATLLSWPEALAAGLSPRQYTIETLFRRLGQKEDPWVDTDRRPVDRAGGQKIEGAHRRVVTASPGRRRRSISIGSA